MSTFDRRRESRSWWPTPAATPLRDAPKRQSSTSDSGSIDVAQPPVGAAGAAHALEVRAAEPVADPDRSRRQCRQQRLDLRMGIAVDPIRASASEREKNTSLNGRSRARGERVAVRNQVHSRRVADEAVVAAGANRDDWRASPPGRSRRASPCTRAADAGARRRRGRAPLPGRRATRLRAQPRTPNESISIQSCSMGAPHAAASSNHRRKNAGRPGGRRCRRPTTSPRPRYGDAGEMWRAWRTSGGRPRRPRRSIASPLVGARRIERVGAAASTHHPGRRHVLRGSRSRRSAAQTSWS